jgi:hypothetical protein
VIRGEDIPIQGETESFLNDKFSSPTCFDLEPLIFAISRFLFKKDRFVDGKDHTLASIDDATVITEVGQKKLNQKILRTHALDIVAANGAHVRVIAGIGFIDGVWKALAPDGSSWRVRRDMTCSPPRLIQEVLIGKI